jgi:hypothetical protein
LCTHNSRTSTGQGNPERRRMNFNVI